MQGEETALAITELGNVIHHNNRTVGWWDDAERYGGKVPDKYMIPTKIALMHSELSEGLEGNRKGLADDHLPHREMEEVEYADAIIRILDVCGYKGYDIGTAIMEKLAYNAQRPDHKREARQEAGGKAV
jgi:hypothetical protein